VIGSGPGGYVAAIKAAQLGLKVRNLISFNFLKALTSVLFKNFYQNLNLNNALNISLIYHLVDNINPTVPDKYSKLTLVLNEVNF